MISALCRGTAADGFAAGPYHHDHDEELGCYWFNSPPPDVRTVAGVAEAMDPAPSRDDEAYWDETASLVMEYVELRASVYDAETLFDDFIDWLQRSPAEGRRYVEGDDMARAALVDWFLTLVQ